MVHRNFVNTQNTSLERDSEGHRTGFKIYIKVRSRISDEGWRRLGVMLKINFAKSPYRWKYYASSQSLGFSNGVPIPDCATDKAFGIWLITYAGLEENKLYAIHSWRGLSNKHKIPVLTKSLAIIEVLSIEKMSFRWTKNGRMKRYWFRKEQKPAGERIQ